MSALLEVRGLRAGFGPTTVLHGVDLDVTTDRMAAVLGLNGAGKSVTMKVVGGLVPAWAGSVVFDGEDITHLSVEERVARGMAFVPQGRQLFPDLTVTENLRLGAYVPRRRDRAGSEKLQSELLERFPRLGERRDQLAGTMSGGEQAMLAVARALMGKPKLLLVDEPSAGLSPLVAGQVFDLLAEVHSSGVAVLLVEQNVALALRVADTAHVMQRGRVVHESAVATLDPDALARHLGVGRLLGSTLATKPAAPDDDSFAPRRPRRRVRATAAAATASVAGAATDGSAPRRATGIGSTPNGSSKNGSAKSASAKNGSTANGSARSGSARSGSARSASATNGSTANGSAKSGSANGSATNGSATNGSAPRRERPLRARTGTDR